MSLPECAQSAAGAALTDAANWFAVHYLRRCRSGEQTDFAKPFLRRPSDALAASAPRATAKAAQGKPDLILLDMALPKIDGFTVFRCLRDNRPLSQIPVAAMTVQTMKGDREEILAAGCDDYIVRPIDPVRFS